MDTRQWACLVFSLVMVVLLGYRLNRTRGKPPEWVYTGAWPGRFSRNTHRAYLAVLMALVGYIFTKVVVLDG